MHTRASVLLVSALEAHILVVLSCTDFLQLSLPVSLPLYLQPCVSCILFILTIEEPEIGAWAGHMVRLAHDSQPLVSTVCCVF